MRVKWLRGSGCSQLVFRQVSCMQHTARYDCCGGMGWARPANDEKMGFQELHHIIKRIGMNLARNCTYLLIRKNLILCRKI